MSNIASKMAKLQSFRHRIPVDSDLISSAEKELGVIFSPEYMEYLKEFGAASYYGHELTGICKSSRLNVVDVTITERENNPIVPKNWYVIEQANIDGIVIWQAETGEIYQTAPNAVPLKLYDSLGEYIEM